MNAFSARLATIKDFLATQRWPSGAELKNLLTWSYYTTVRPSGSSPFVVLTMAIILLILVALAWWWWRLWQLQRRTPVYNLLLDQLPTLIVFTVIFSLLFAFCSAEGIQYLSSPLVLLVASIVLVIWVGILVYYTWRRVPPLRQAYLEKERFFRYLPKKKAKI